MREFLKRRAFVVILWSLVILVGAGYGVHLWSSRPQSSSPQTTKVTKTTLTQTISASGQVASSGQVSVTTQASGKVDKVYVSVGQAVKKGDKILDIDPDLTTRQSQQAAWASYLAAKNTLNQAYAQLSTLEAAKAEAERKFNDDAVATGKATTDPVYIQLKAAKEAAAAAYNNQSGVISHAKAALESTHLSYQKTSSAVVASADGTIQDLSYNEGSYIAASSSSSASGAGGSGTSVATLRFDSKTTIALNVSEIDIAGVQVGQDATITFTALSGKTYHGKVVGVGSTGTTTSNVTTFPVILEITDGGSEIRVGMAASSDITTQVKKDVLALPNQTIKTTDGVHTVTVIKGGKQQTVTVTVGLVLDTMTEITSGLSEGDEVVIPSTSSASSAASNNDSSSTPKMAPAPAGN